MVEDDLLTTWHPITEQTCHLIYPGLSLVSYRGENHAHVASLRPFWNTIELKRARILSDEEFVEECRKKGNSERSRFIYGPILVLQEERQTYWAIPRWRRGQFHGGTHVADVSFARRHWMWVIRVKHHLNIAKKPHQDVKIGSVAACSTWQGE